MSNMSYCRFVNTFQDLTDCNRSMHEDDMDDLSEGEAEYRKKLIDLCVDIALEFGDEIGREVVEYDEYD